MTSTVIAPGVLMRSLRAEDAAAMSRANLRNREHLRPWSPRRAEDVFTEEGQAARILKQLEQRDAGRFIPWVLESEGEIVGSVTLSFFVPLMRSANLGYWIDVGQVGRGLATAAAAQACRLADEEVGLHRLEAGTMPANTASQRVLDKCGFTLLGRATDFLHVNGQWRDHLIYQKTLNDRPPA